MLTATIVVFVLYALGMIGFTALPAARRFKRACWNDLPLDWRLYLDALIVIGIFGDFVANQTRAALSFWGFEEILLTARIQARVDRGLRDERTRRWVRILNTGDPGPPPHIKLPADWEW